MSRLREKHESQRWGRGRRGRKGKGRETEGEGEGRRGTCLEENAAVRAVHAAQHAAAYTHSQGSRGNGNGGVVVRV